MIKFYSDLTISYYIVSIIGIIMWAIVIADLPFYFIAMLVWIFICAMTFHRISVHRFNKLFSEPANPSKTEENINKLFGIYKGRINTAADLIIANYISTCLFHFGKYSYILKLLLRYDPEKLLKFKRQLTHKYIYYYNLSLCYFKMGRHEEAIAYFMKADAVFNDRHFNQKHVLAYKLTHRTAFLQIIKNGEDTQEILSLLTDSFSKSEMSVAKVSIAHSIISTLVRNDRLDEATEYIDFVKQNGGDTVYAKCAIANDYSGEVEKQINDEPWEPSPVTKKHYKTLVISIIISVLMIAVTVLYGIFGLKARLINNSANSTAVHYDYGINKMVDDLYHFIFDPFQK